MAMTPNEVFIETAKALSIPLFEKTDTAERFSALVETAEAQKSETFAEQNAVAEHLGFLKSGKVRFYKQRGPQAQAISASSQPMLPLGISGMNSPGRYMSEVRLAEGSEYLTLDLQKLRDLYHYDPSFAAQFLALTLGQATYLLWASRGLDAPIPAVPNQKPSQGVIQGTDHNILDRVKDAPFFAPLGTDRLADLLKYAELRLFSAGENIAVEGHVSSGLQILFSGRVLAKFTDARDGAPTERSRTVVRPGVALSWHNGFSEFAAPYTVTASRDTSMLCFSAEAIQKLISDDPILASVLMQRQIWQIGRYQQTAAGLSKTATDDEASHLEALLQDNGARIPVESVLHGVPHALRNRFTVGYGLDCVYDAIINGNSAERSVAGLMMDVLDGVEREHRFFSGLNAVYTRVTSAERNSNPSVLRQLSNADFSRAFDQVPFVIKGMENLPDTPTNIFFYNHLAACPDNELANGHAFSVDSHFLSSKILLPKYGDGGQRIVRSSRKTEFWRNGYYARLDNIFVHNAESDWLEETPEEKAWRKEKFFIEAQKTFDLGRPLSIAPEGTSETPDNLTPTSPGPFKPGAFMLAARLQPEPYLVPIALANFDYSIARTTYAAVIKAPFRIRDHVKNIDDKSEMQDFLDNYREVFRGYVIEAQELAAEADHKKGDMPEGVVTNVGLVSPIEEEFETDVRALEARISNANRTGLVALYGSSTFRLWTDAARDLGQNDVINLGFGGATLSACRSYFKRVVLPHNPDTLIFYAGDNDIGGGVSGADLAKEFELFMSEVAETLPSTRCLVVSIKPSPFRAAFQPQIQEANARIKSLTQSNPRWDYIDFHSQMLDETGAPSPVFYDEDPLHVNMVGYGLLSKLLRDALQS